MSWNSELGSGLVARRKLDCCDFNGIVIVHCRCYCGNPRDPRVDLGSGDAIVAWIGIAGDRFVVVIVVGMLNCDLGLL